MHPSPEQSDPPPVSHEPGTGAAIRPWPAATVTLRDLTTIREYPRNPKTHTDEQIDLLVRSMQRFGFTAPLLVDEAGELIYGHGRFRAASKLGLVRVPVCVAEGWSDDEKRAYRLADNQLGSERLAPYDVPMLKLEVSELKLAGFDMPLLGFQNIELQKLTSGAGRDPDASPLLNPISFIMPGDLWHLGDHRLLCGSSTDPAAVARLLGDVKPHLMVTDPPYGVEYDPTWRENSKLNQWANTRMTGTVPEDHRIDWREAWALFGGDVAYVWCASWFIGETQRALQSCKLEPRALIIWRKSHFAISRGHYHWQHEPCMYAVRKGGTAHWCGGRKQTTVWDILGFQVAGGHREEAKTGHGTQKPLECMAIPMLNNSQPGDAVYDPFVGSGTTIMAAEVNGRRCFALDIDPGYVDVTIRRWQDFTGKTATLEDGRGRTYDQVCDEREASGGFTQHQAASNRGEPVQGSDAQRAVS